VTYGSWWLPLYCEAHSGRRWHRRCARRDILTLAALLSAFLLRNAHAVRHADERIRWAIDCDLAGSGEWGGLPVVLSARSWHYRYWPACARIHGKELCGQAYFGPTCPMLCPALFLGRYQKDQIEGYTKRLTVGPGCADRTIAQPMLRGWGRSHEINGRPAKDCGSRIHGGVRTRVQTDPDVTYARLAALMTTTVSTAEAQVRVATPDYDGPTA